MSQRGFTLLEVLVALAVLGLLLLGLAQSLHFGLAAWRGQTSAIARSGEMDAVDRTLRTLIEDMTPDDSFAGALAMTGGAHTLSFRTRLPRGLGAMAVDANVGLGVDAAHVLVLRSWPRYRSLSSAAPITETALLRDIQDIDIDYWDPAAAIWRDAWRADGLPGLVRIRIVFATRSVRAWPDIVAAPRRQRLQT